jgi:hypothetical protein
LGAGCRDGRDPNNPKPSAPCGGPGSGGGKQKATPFPEAWKVQTPHVDEKEKAMRRKKKKTVLINLESDERYPDFSFRRLESIDALPSGYPTAFEVPSETIERWELVAKLYEHMQSEMSEMADEASAVIAARERDRTK